LHTGEAELTGRNYKGPELHRCARLRAIAHGGQTLLSFATAHLLGKDLLPPRVVLKPLGSHHLRGFSEPEEVFQLCHPELPSMFPQLHTEAPEATESEQDPRHLLDQLSEPVVAANGEGRIVYLNPAAERLLGWEQDELLGHPLLTIVPHRLRPAHLAGFERYLATRRAKVLGRTVRVVALRRDGTEVPVDLNLNAAEDSRGRQTFVATLHASEHEPGATESEPIQMLD
jgi:PAS domain S-box-containing protein